MNKKLLLSLLLAGSFSSCRHGDRSDAIVSMQILDRNGFSETISVKERLKVYQNVDFLTAQPYEKVLRIYGKDREGKSHSKLTCYHETGGPWQYLEAVDGRAQGKYLQWHENGKVKIEGHIIEGLADFSPAAQKSWLFDGPCTVWDEWGNLEATFHYEKGRLSGQATYYHPDSTIKQLIPYERGLVHGTLQKFDREGHLIKVIPFIQGKQEGKAFAKWSPELFRYQELYREGLLISASYFDPSGEKVAAIDQGEGVRAHFRKGKLRQLTSYRNGTAEGKVSVFDAQGQLQITYQLKEGKKEGEEWEFYPSESEERRPKLLVTWFGDQMQGMVKTWYDNGVMESQREMSANKKHGISFAYYRTGDLMMMEEYENDRLTKGSYFKKGDKRPVSTIERGDGTATLYSAEGHFMKKVTYERGKPVVD